MKADYETRKVAVDKYAEKYDDNRRQKIEKLNSHYATIVDQRTNTWNNRMKAGQLVEYYKPARPAAQLTAANARTIYEEFVQNVKNNTEKHDINDIISTPNVVRRVKHMTK